MKLSGGEKQRIGIARAILKSAPIFILDEATSALDVQTEAEILQTLGTELEGHSAIVIAHRIITVKNMDYLYCMDHGRIVEEGSPVDLFRKKGYFYDMCRKQDITIGGNLG